MTQAELETLLASLKERKMLAVFTRTLVYCSKGKWERAIRPAETRRSNLAEDGVPATSQFRVVVVGVKPDK
jgi:hypothetical protein